MRLTDSLDAKVDILDPCADLNSGEGGHCEQGICVCEAGFQALDDTCIDVDECTTGIDNCSDNASCTGTEGRFRCGCKTG